MQRHHRLSGAGATLYHENPGLWRSDDLVLFGLNGGNDVTQLSGATALDRRHERAVSAQSTGVHESARTVPTHVETPGQTLVVSDAEVSLAEQFVLDPEQGGTLDHEVSAAGQTHGLAAGGTVEGFGDRCSPVDNDRVAVLVGHRQTADVEALGRRRVLARSVGFRTVGFRLDQSVDAAEHQCRVAQVEVGEATDQLLVDGVALEPVLEGAPHPGFGEFANFPGVLPTEFEACIRVLDVDLLVVEIRVLNRHRCHEGFRNSNLVRRERCDPSDAGARTSTRVLSGTPFSGSHR